MYSTCIFCNKPLGSNEVLERFPVGRRIAFDSAMGRLWVVCRNCERWNLSPLEERLEVIDECERLYSIERKRVSTENIGLAKLNEGLELVRIGKPMRPEFAAWRYGDQFGRRRRRNYIITGSAFAAVAGIYAAGWALGGAGFVGMGGVGRLVRRLTQGSPNKVVAKINVGDYPLIHTFEIRQKYLDRMTILKDSGPEGFRVAYRHGRKKTEIREIRGEPALEVLQKTLPLINRFSGGEKTVSTAVSMIDHLKDPGEFVKVSAKDVPRWERIDVHAIRNMPESTRLALEMAVHEDAERRALEGELKGLALAWKEAEQIASISDSLFTSSFITSALERMKGE